MEKNRRLRVFVALLLSVITVFSYGCTPAPEDAKCKLTIVDKPSEISAFSVNSGDASLATGAEVDKDTELTISWTAGVGYKAVLYINNVSVSDASSPYTYKVTADVAIEVKAIALHTITVLEPSTGITGFSVKNGNDTLALGANTIEEGATLRIEWTLLPNYASSVLTVNGTEVVNAVSGHSYLVSVDAVIQLSAIADTRVVTIDASNAVLNSYTLKINNIPTNNLTITAIKNDVLRIEYDNTLYSFSVSLNGTVQTPSNGVYIILVGDTNNIVIESDILENRKSEKILVNVLPTSAENRLLLQEELSVAVLDGDTPIAALGIGKNIVDKKIDDGDRVRNVTIEGKAILKQSTDLKVFVLMDEDGTKSGSAEVVDRVITFSLEPSGQVLNVCVFVVDEEETFDITICDEDGDDWDIDDDSLIAIYSSNTTAEMQDGTLSLKAGDTLYFNYTSVDVENFGFEIHVNGKLYAKLVGYRPSYSFNIFEDCEISIIAAEQEDVFTLSFLDSQDASLNVSDISAYISLTCQSTPVQGTSISLPGGMIIEFNTAVGLGPFIIYENDIEIARLGGSHGRVFSYTILHDANIKIFVPKYTISFIDQDEQELDLTDISSILEVWYGETQLEDSSVVVVGGESLQFSYNTEDELNSAKIYAGTTLLQNLQVDNPTYIFTPNSTTIITVVIAPAEKAVVKFEDFNDNPVSVALIPNLEVQYNSVGLPLAVSELVISKGDNLKFSFYDGIAQLSILVDGENICTLSDTKSTFTYTFNSFTIGADIVVKFEMSTVQVSFVDSANEPLDLAANPDYSVWYSNSFGGLNSAKISSGTSFEWYKGVILFFRYNDKVYTVHQNGLEKAKIQSTTVYYGYAIKITENTTIKLVADAIPSFDISFEFVDEQDAPIVLGDILELYDINTQPILFLDQGGDSIDYGSISSISKKFYQGYQIMFNAKSGVLAENILKIYVNNELRATLEQGVLFYYTHTVSAAATIKVVREAVKPGDYQVTVSYVNEQDEPLVFGEMMLLMNVAKVMGSTYTSFASDTVYLDNGQIINFFTNSSDYSFEVYIDNELWQTIDIDNNSVDYQINKDTTIKIVVVGFVSSV